MAVRLPTRASRESCLTLETKAFERAVTKFVRRTPERAADCVAKLALDLLRFAVRGTPMVTGRAAAGWLPFADAQGARLPVRGSGVGRGRREGSYSARLRGVRPRVEVTNAVPYITVIEVGSGPHIIEPRPPRRALKFVGRNGEYIFRRRVQHPGTRAYRPLMRAMRRLRRFTARAFEGLQKT